MNLSVMSLSRIRDLVSNLGWKGEDQAYTPGPDCLNALDTLEDALKVEDVLNRNVRIGMHFNGTVKKDLIPILSHGKDFNIIAVATRVLVEISSPTESLVPFLESHLTSKHQNVYRQLTSFSLSIKKAFLDCQASLALVTILRDTIIKSEKHHVPLTPEHCEHLKNCLLLLRNILHLSDNSGLLPPFSPIMMSELKSVQNKLIWNLFVQGVDGALLLMLNSKYRNHWSVPISIIIALIYRNQNIRNVHNALEMISSASESSGDDEESDGSKNSSISLSSEHSKVMSDSGCPQSSDTQTNSLKNKRNISRYKEEALDIHCDLEKVKISDDVSGSPVDCENGRAEEIPSEENDSESSCSSESPYHKRTKQNNSEHMSVDGSSSDDCKKDSALSMDQSSSPTTKSSDDEAIQVKNLKAVQKLRCLQKNLKMSESDSSNEEFQEKKTKYRSHPPTGRRGKSPRRMNGCTPTVCINSAYEVSCNSGRMRFPLWEKRNSVSALVDINSSTPTDDDIGNLMKEFTLSFMHSGFSHLVVDLKELLAGGSSIPPPIDKSLFFWLVSYFLHLATTANICLDHISDVLSVDIIGYLVYETVNVCEACGMQLNDNEKIRQYVATHLSLLVVSLKEIMFSIDLYSRKCNSSKDKAFFNELCGKIAGIQDLRNLPLLLFQNCLENSAQGLIEDVIILNHLLLVIIGKGLDHCKEINKINFMSHLKMFSSKHIVNCYERVLQKFKSNSHFLNNCTFTMMHHLAGDLRSSELLFEPSILKIFSDILKEEIELEQYQEDLIMYILHKFSLKVYQQNLKEKKETDSDLSVASTTYSCASSSCVLSEDDDDLFWWYLQFEQDKDPITRISEHISTSKQDILSKLQCKGHISTHKYDLLKQEMEENSVQNKETPENSVVAKKESPEVSSFDDDITLLLRTLVQAGERQFLIWLQDVLLETCYVKLGATVHYVEPIQQFSMKTNHSVPLVPYTEEQKTILNDDTFLQLLQKLGFYVGSRSQPMFPRIPLFWTTDTLFNIAARLGPIRKDKLKFSCDEIVESESANELSFKQAKDCPNLPPLSSCFTLSSWLEAVQQSKDFFRANHEVDAVQ